ncbi:MAG: CYTH domain-containing protein [Candidatus Daviesbacteria bacterium]|nr:CYTH domain-containing protein [Candidatus Daviesbacteria bacterium]
MDIEFEATFPNIDKNEIREKLKELDAVLKKPEYMQKRVVFKLPKGHEIKGGWLRVRDEGDKITMSLKVIDGDNIDDQKEIYLKVSDFQQAELLLSSIGCEKKAYQESKRELWILDDVEVTIDEWPFLEPYLEVEGKSKEIVEEVSKKLGFDFNKALFCSVDKLYNLKYGISQDIINNQTPEIIFGGKNPFSN